MPALTKLTFTSAITDESMTLNVMAKHVLDLLQLSSSASMEFFSDEACSQMCMGTSLNEGEHFFMKIDREEYERFVLGEM